MLQIENLHKRFAVPVLQGVDFDVRPGEVHALMGANGAGKTTLSNIICGLLQPDAGSMTCRGQPYSPASINDAEAAGIRMVMQELNQVGNLSVAENLFLKRIPQRLGFVNFNELFRQARKALDQFGLSAIDPRQPMSSLGVGLQQLIEISAVLQQPCKLLILDEPTAALTDPQIDCLFEQITRLKAEGAGIIYISHRMEEIQRISDRITVLRDGMTVATLASDKCEMDEIVALMTGRDTLDAAAFSRRAPGPVAVRLEHISRGKALRDISLDIHRGEVLGIAGLVGSGRTELLRAIYGADPIDSGCVKMGAPLDPVTIRSPRDAVTRGIGLIPEDRKQQGLLLSQSASHNISIASLAKLAGIGGWIDRLRERQAAQRYRQSLSIKLQDLNQTVRELSGGNQQKTIIARWLLKDCSVLLFDEPTRGIDIQTKTMIYHLLDALAAQGKAIVVVSSETGELTTVCDRIAVLSNGKLAAIFARGDWTGEKITAAAFSGY